MQRVLFDVRKQAELGLTPTYLSESEHERMEGEKSLSHVQCLPEM